MENNNKKTYWPHMIVGFLAVGLTLSYWTIKSANALPVQESNQYMLKYQKADMTMNDILEKKKAFDAKYDIVIKDIETMVMTDNIHSHRLQANPVALVAGKNNFSYEVVSKDGSIISDANVTFLLTQPHHRSQDQLFSAVPFSKGRYSIENVTLSKAGRYTLQLRAEVGKTTGYSEIPAYLKPSK